MAIARSTISLFGFLATTALGIGLTFVNKKAGIGVAVAGAVCSVANLIYNLCIRNITPTQPIEKGWQAVDTKGKVSLLESDDDDDKQREGASDPLSDVPLVPDNKPAVRHSSGVITKIGATLSSMISRKDHAKEL
jgi:hypothetical protein